MRMLMRVSIPVEAGNHAARTGTLGSTMQKILETIKPEAAYFAEDNGEHTGFIFFNMEKSSDLPAVAEPWFLAFNAAVEIVPAMKPEDLSKAEPHIKKAAKKYGGR